MENEQITLALQDAQGVFLVVQKGDRVDTVLTGSFQAERMVGAVQLALLDLVDALRKAKKERTENG
jgi:hypothetical protein